MKIAIVSHFPSTIQRLSNLVTVEQPNQIIWVANNGQEAVKRCAQLSPDILLMDMVMPVMDGIAATRIIMQTSPCAILILTSSIDSYPQMVLDAIKTGAIDVLNTPGEQDANTKIFLNKINVIGRLITQKSDVFKRSVRHKSADSAQPSSIGQAIESKQSLTPIANTTTNTGYLVAIGASTGGPGAVLGILQELTANFPAPIVVVQHVEDEFLPGLATWFGKNISLTTKIAQDEDYPQIGQVSIAGGSRHLVLSRRQTLCYIDQVDMLYHPSVDLFFNSLVEHWPGKIIGILLTGIGWDGASGLKKLRDAGHTTIAQNQKSCIVYGMPKAAIELGAVEHVLPPDQIGSMLKRLVPCSFD